VLAMMVVGRDAGEIIASRDLLYAKTHASSRRRNAKAVGGERLAQGNEIERIELIQRRGEEQA
jgi:hypothetical protein